MNSLLRSKPGVHQRGNRNLGGSRTSPNAEVTLAAIRTPRVASRKPALKAGLYRRYEALGRPAPGFYDAEQTAALRSIRFTSLQLAFDRQVARGPFPYTARRLDEYRRRNSAPSLSVHGRRSGDVG